MNSLGHQYKDFDGFAVLLKLLFTSLLKLLLKTSLKIKLSLETVIHVVSIY